MKIYFKNKAARLKRSLVASCKRCPFFTFALCPFGKLTIIDCQGKGWWVDGESLDIFKV